MATKRMIAREKRLIAKSHNEKNIATRQHLKSLIRDPETDPVKKMEAIFKLQKRPLAESKTHSVNRCKCCGRPKGVYKFFGLCRICLRQFFNKGMLPGLVKSSW